MLSKEDTEEHILNLIRDSNLSDLMFFLRYNPVDMNFAHYPIRLDYFHKYHSIINLLWEFSEIKNSLQDYGTELYNELKSKDIEKNVENF